MPPSLKTRRFVSENSDVVQYTLMGDLDSLKRLFELGLAGVNDSELDGWTLLIVSEFQVSNFERDLTMSDRQQHIMESVTLLSI